MNATIEKFGYPATLIAEWDHWVLLLRPAQPTLGSCVLAARSDATAFGALPAEAHAELAVVTAALETMLRALVSYEKLNYLMLMMVDPHVHFHVIPRYEGHRAFADIDIPDIGWPGPPDLKQALQLDADAIESLITEMKRKIG